MNKFENDLKSAMTEHEKEMVENFDKVASESSDVLSKSSEEKILNTNKSRNKPIWKTVLKYAAIAVAAFILVVIASVSIVMFSVGNMKSAPPNDNFDTSEAPMEAPKASESPMNDQMGAVEESKMESGADETFKRESPKGMENKSKVDSEQKLIYNYNVTLETTTFDKSIENVNQMIKESGGYIENSYANDSGIYSKNRTRNAYFMLRIPRAKTNAFMSEITEKIGQITNKNQNVENVTRHYRDTERQIEISKIKEERLIALLKKADKMEDILKIESSLSDIIAQREYNENMIKNYDHDIAFDRLELNIQEVFEPTVVKKTPISLGDKIQSAFENSLEGIKNFSENLLLFLIRSWIILLVIAVIAVLIITIIKRKHHKK